MLVTSGAPLAITSSNRGADQNPVYSPDGRTIIYGSLERPGFEADKGRLMAYDRATRVSRELLPRWDRSADSYAFSPGGDAIYISAADRGRDKIFRIARSGSGWSTTPQLLSSGRNNTALSVSRDGKTLAWLQDATARPAEVFVATTGSAGLSGVRQLTHENDALIAQLKLYPVEDFWFIGANGDSVQGFLLKPPQFQPGKKFPVLFLIHGGPQGAFNDSWGYRWNPQVFANNGYVAFLPNPRGSTGYGQQFVNEISADWGGKAYTDIMNGVADVLRRNSFIDRDRIGAAGASYGGYMINWIEGHNNDPRFPFKVLVSHDGVYNLESMYGATEELWFTDWEFKGTPWTNPAMYARWSPSKFVKNFKTPLLIVHGELDYRVPFGESLQLFTALKRMGVDSKLLVFPDEGHWVLKPQNSQLWYHTVLDWLDKYLK